MGHTTEIVCPSCGYEAFTDGGPSGGFYVFTNTYVCLGCRSLIDLVTGKRAPDDFEGIDTKSVEHIDPDNIHEGRVCNKCSGNSFVLWDSVKRPCPKCYTKMIHNPNAQRTIFWD